MRKEIGKKIKVAILAEEPVGWGSGKHYFPIILDNYTWKTQNGIYQIQTVTVTDKDIINNMLLKESFDVLLIPGGGVGDGACLTKGFNTIPSVKKWKKNIKRFIQHGGGFVGICGGTALITSLVTDCKSKTFVEKQYHKSAIGVSTVKSYYPHLAFPLFYLKQQKHPERVGAAAYVFSFHPGFTDDGRYLFTAGVPVDFKIDKYHSFFRGYEKDVLRMRWWGGPGLLLSEENKRDITVLASYPEKDFSQQPETRIHAWVYVGGLHGLIKGLKKALYFIKNNQYSFTKLFTLLFYFAGDWKKSKKDINLRVANKAAIIQETYPNEHKGRMFLCSTHPEYMIWDGGYITERDDRRFNCIADGFHQWKDIKGFSKDGIKELTSTWWVVRRAVAWAAKVPEQDYPPIEKVNSSDEEVKRLAQDLFWNKRIKSQIEDI